MKRLLAFMLASILLVSAQLVFAQAPEDEDDPTGLFEQKPMLGRLKLNDQQKKQVEQMWFDMQKQMVGVRARRQTAMLELRQLLSAENPDKAAIEKKMNEGAQIGVQAATMRLNQWFEVNKILTADQQQVWKEMLKHPLRDHIKARMAKRFRGGQCRCEEGPMMRGPKGPSPMHEEMMKHPMPEKK